MLLLEPIHEKFISDLGFFIDRQNFSNFVEAKIIKCVFVILSDVSKPCAQFGR